MSDEKKACFCQVLSQMSPGTAGPNHNMNCKKFRTEKFPYLFTFDAATKEWVLAPKMTIGLFIIDDQPIGEHFAVYFHREMLTDEEFIITIGGTIGNPRDNTES